MDANEDVEDDIRADMRPYEYVSEEREREYLAEDKEDRVGP